MRALRQLLTPIRYMLISGREKRVIDVFVPLLLSGFSLWGFYAAAPIASLGREGLVAMVNELLQVLVGFYVAALAAVATFPSEAMKQTVLNVELEGTRVSRRKFLCYLFGYLAVVSLSLYLAGVFALLANQVLSALSKTHPWTRYVALGAYLALFWNMVSVTLLGLHYLIDRAHRADPIVLTGPKQPKP